MIQLGNKESQLKRIFIGILIAFICIQPLLDTIWFYDGTIPEIFGFTIPTILRLGVVGVLAILTLWGFRNNRLVKFFAIYLAVVLVYYIAHVLHCKNFHSVNPIDFNYSAFGEAVYIMRMMIPMFIILYCVVSEITNKKFELLTVLVTLVMSLCTFITNILKISLGSYTNERIHGNIFDWFLHKGSFTSNELASKGFLYFSISSTVMLITYPYILYMFMRDKKKEYAILAFLEAIALLMIGTKITAYGTLMMTVIMLFVYLFCGVVKKDFKVDRRVICIITIFIVALTCTFYYSPAKLKQSFDSEYAKQSDKDDIKKKKNHKSTNFRRDENSMINFIEGNLHFISIKEEFLEDSYNYKEDPLFWYDVIRDYTPSLRMQNRIVEKLMLERVKSINNDPKDNWLGIGYTRTSNIYNLEKDFLYQYYSIGYIGAFLLTGPYIILIILAIFKMLFRFKNKMNIKNCSLILGTGFTCCSAYFSGNTLESLGITIVLAAFYGEILMQILLNKQE